MDWKNPELCVEVSDLGQQCASGAALGVAILVELCIYFWVFIGGYKLVRRLLKADDKVKIQNHSTSNQWNKK
tara:strand:- start:4984 stop:5199 length:216 start_codon:yes stop_codon:yes gene_type:complete